MKYLIHFFSLVIWSDGISQVNAIICGKVKSQDKFSITFYQPINGYYNVAFFDTLKQNSSLVNGTDSIYKIIQLEKPSFIKIYFRDANNQFITTSDLLIFPGDSLHINFDLNVASSKAMEYEGTNAKGQQLFNEINYQPYNKFIPVFDVMDMLPFNKKTFLKEIDSVVFSVISKFHSLQKKMFVSSEYVEYMTVCFKSLFYGEVLDKFLRPGKKREVINKQVRDSMMAAIFLLQNPNDIKLKGLYLAPFYINNYYNYLTYKKYNLNSIKQLRSGGKLYKVGQKDFLIQEDFAPFIYIPDEKIKEDLWALEIIGFFSWIPGKYDASVIAQYDSIFPNTKWQTLLVKQFENKYVQKNIGYKLQSPIHFVDTVKNINNIKSLLTELSNNKPVFIDLWASWCGPCIAAFGYNKQLDSFLIKNDINKLYISFDDETNRDKWRLATNKYLLGGYHILANDSLKAEIKKEIYHYTGNKGMGIPRYILVNKNGKVVIEDAYSPQDFEQLKEQISISLLKN